MGINLYDKNILITGGSGLLGSELKNTIPNAYFPTHDKFDILKPSRELFHHLVENKIHLVVHAAAMINKKINMEDRESKDLAYSTNVVGTANLTDACVKARCSLYYISTDYVFDGKEAPYKESHTPNPQNFYAMTKLMGELAVTLARGYIIRTSFCGKNWDHDLAYTNIYSSRDRVDIIAGFIAMVIERSDRWRGTLHVGTPKKSFYQLSQTLENAKFAKPGKATIGKDTSFDLTMMQAILKD